MSAMQYGSDAALPGRAALESLDDTRTTLRSDQAPSMLESDKLDHDKVVCDRASWAHPRRAYQDRS